MNWNQVEGNWEQFKGKVQTQWGKLTGDDLDVIKGNRKQLAASSRSATARPKKKPIARSMTGWARTTRPPHRPTGCQDAVRRPFFVSVELIGREGQLIASQVGPTR